MHGKSKTLLAIVGLAMSVATGPGPAAQSEEKTPGSRTAPPAREAPRREAPAQVDARVTMVADAGRLKVGQHLTLTVKIDATHDVGHVPFHVRFDPTVLHFESGEEGGYLGTDGRETAFFAGPTSSGDTVVVGLSRLGKAEGVTGAGELCRLHFVAVGVGSAALGFERATVRDGNNRILRSSFVPARVVVE